MAGEISALFDGLDLATLAPGVGLLTVGVWFLRARRAAAWLRLAGIVAVALAGVLAAGSATGVVRVDAGAALALAEATARVLADVLGALVRT